MLGSKSYHFRYYRIVWRQSEHSVLLRSASVLRIFYKSVNNMKKPFRKLKKHINTVNKTKLAIKGLLFVLEQIIAITLSVVICVNATTALGYLNIGNNRLKLADQLRQDNSYAESVNWYKKIANSKRKSFQKYKPYANLALGEIYIEELDNVDYKLALKFYKDAINDISNKDIRVYKSFLRFAANQINMYQQLNEECINIYNTEFVQLIVESINGIYELSPEMLSNYDLEFPINDYRTRELFDIETTISKTLTEWKYVSTIVSKDAGLSEVKDDEKILLADSWQERADDYSASVNTYYKYYRYKSYNKTENISGLDFIREIAGRKNRIYLISLQFDKNGNLIVGEVQ